MATAYHFIMLIILYSSQVPFLKLVYTVAQMCSQKNQFRARKISVQYQKNHFSAGKVQKITNRIDWILSKQVYDVVTMFIAPTKILEREGSISPSRFYGQLSDYQSHVLTLIYSVGQFSFKEEKTQIQSNISFYCFMFGVNQENQEAGGVQDSLV